MPFISPKWTIELHINFVPCHNYMERIQVGDKEDGLSCKYIEQ